ncbi:hypothetical protein I2I05_14785 [Hymenobacter sp. BT683]|uniref:Uncharacterized protein n=1 Tax=Hymenobacter jeongseonensis TaxID=2791027 RepID=A0ABS0IJV8_9BACT|nr:hypothetical protein [Hymenobacter jeongseonensis]MBF9238668.1 hypothetical protein [Hymenobacter jeongseonensis]
MGKGKKKKKHSNNDPVSEDLLDAAALSVRKFRKVTKEIQKLSTGQKVVGGLALVAAGLAYLAQHDFETEATDANKPATTAPHAHALHAADATPTDEEKAAANGKPHVPRKSRKTPKAKIES